MNSFLQDVIQGLSAKEKHLNSKYFYDATGDRIFQQIMACPEYYPTSCEAEIFTTQKDALVDELARHYKEFDIVELGAGDATKSVHLLEALIDHQVRFTYFPVDISSNVISLLNRELPEKLPTLQLHGLNGEYFSMLERAKTLSQKIKVVLFLGGNIGNFSLPEAQLFCKELRTHLKTGDLVLIGVDLQKDPQTILNAYNDSTGQTREFNLNLLRRINRELQADFNTDNFYHYPTYDPITGACRSFLVSTCEQQVHVDESTFTFNAGEPIYMEISQKFTVEQTDALARQSGFTPVKHFYDSRHWFLDAVWECI